MKHTRILYIAAIALVALSLAACDIPFSYTTDPFSASAPGNVAGYAETVITTPSAALATNLRITTVTINYTVTNNSDVAQEVSMYAGLAQVADTVSTNDSLVFKTPSIAAGGTSTGTASIPLLAQALKQSSFVIGIGNSAAGTTGTIGISYTVTIDGTVGILK